MRTLEEGGSLGPVAHQVREAVRENQAGSTLCHWGLSHVLDAIGFSRDPAIERQARANDALAAAEHAVRNARQLREASGALARA